jgi:glycine hydroxymethyltransferase
MPQSFIFHDRLADLDPALHELLRREDARQAGKIILIASESAAPTAVQEALTSSFANIYAEGYPRPESRRQTEAEILDYGAELAYHNRYSDPRYYKGVELANLLEAVTRRRAAELFAANAITADNLFVNVQALSGAPANNAVYTALLQPGDTIMGLDLNYGGHLSHGSKIHRSGKIYNAVRYTLDAQTEQLDYEAIEQLALETKPQIIVAGYSAYPRIINWQRFREIADKCGAYLMADIAHISGLVAAGVHPSPIGIAHVVTTTTHKSLCGPRGAMIMTHLPDLAAKLDRAVFPGEQGGPHLNSMAALAVALRLAKTDRFRQLQERIVQNAARLAQKLEEHGLRIVGGGTDNHLVLVDVKSINHQGVHLSGDMAARVLDLADIVTNRNTIPGDPTALSASGLRLGTVWISQLGYGEAEVDQLAEAMAITLKGCTPFAYTGPGGRRQLRTKVNFAALQQTRAMVSQLTGQLPQPPASDTLDLRGAELADFLDGALTTNARDLPVGQTQATHLLGPGLDLPARLLRLAADRCQIRFNDPAAAGAAALWLAALSDGFALFDDLYGKLPGPVVVSLADQPADGLRAPDQGLLVGNPDKPFFVGYRDHAGGEPLPPFAWSEPSDPPLRRTSLYETHVALGARMVPFAGWDMPVWYSSVTEEHAAVRQAAGLFDVSHMGVLEASGPNALPFLQLVTTNDVSRLAVGEAHYNYFLFPDGRVVDDLFIYRRGEEKFLIVVNASNNDKNWAWLNAVNEGRVLIDEERPWARLQYPAVLRDLRDPQWGEECRVDLALQGPRATDILLAMGSDESLARRIKGLPWANLTEGNLGGFDIVISRTGYTGERVAYELFVHPDQAPAFWQALLAAGEPLGLKSIGLAARDSLRTEAGLPLYGHELAGPLDLNPGDAGFSSFVKLWKPFFIGRQPFKAREEKRDQVVARFRMNEKGVRRPELGDPVLDKRGKVVGTVTSCAIDSDGYLLGQALLPLELATPDTAVAIYQLGGGSRELKLPPAVKPGARMPMPDGATVLSRFPMRKK